MIKTLLICFLIVAVVEIIFYFGKRDSFWKYLRNRIIYYAICFVVIYIFL